MVGTNYMLSRISVHVAGLGPTHEHQKIEGTITLCETTSIQTVMFETENPETWIIKVICLGLFGPCVETSNSAAEEEAACSTFSGASASGRV